MRGSLQPASARQQLWDVVTSGSSTSEIPDPAGSEWSGVITVMIKHIPSRCSQKEVLEAIANIGFALRYTFFYLPTKARNHLNFGYAFVGFATEQDVTDFRQAMEGFQFPRRNSSKVISLVPARIQGIIDNVSHFQGSRVLESAHAPIFRLAL